MAHARLQHVAQRTAYRRSPPLAWRSKYEGEEVTVVSLASLNVLRELFFVCNCFCWILLQERTLSVIILLIWGFEGGLETNKSRHVMKWFVSFSSLVNASARFCLPPMCSTVIKPSWTCSRTAFSCICMCRNPFVVMLWLHLTAASLSFWMGIGSLLVKTWRRFRSVRMFEMCWRHFVHSSTV
jgi:hypothetical protein